MFREVGGITGTGNLKDDYFVDYKPGEENCTGCNNEEEEETARFDSGGSSVL